MTPARRRAPLRSRHAPPRRRGRRRDRRAARRGPSQRRLRGDARRRPARRLSRRLRSTSSCSTSGCPTSTASPSVASSARARTSRSSWSRRRARRSIASSASSSAPTTTSSSRSASASWWPGSEQSPAAARRERHGHETLSVGALEVDVPARRATLAGRELGLTVKEFDLLALLASDPDVVVDRPQDPEGGVGHDVVRLVEDGRRPRRVAAQEARRPDARRDGARRRVATARMTRRLLFSYLSLTVVVLAMLEVPLGFVNARNERANLTAKVERDAVSVASLSEGTLEGETTASNVAGLERLATRYAADTGGRVVITNRAGHRDRRLGTARARATQLRRPAGVPGGAGGGRRDGVRGSRTLGYSFLYVAVPVASGRRHPRRRTRHLSHLEAGRAHPSLLARARRHRRDRARGRHPRRPQVRALDPPAARRAGGGRRPCGCRRPRRARPRARRPPGDPGARARVQRHGGARRRARRPHSGNSSRMPPTSCGRR